MGKAKDIILFSTYICLLFGGALIASLLSYFNISQAPSFNTACGILSIIVLVLIFLLLIIEVISMFRIKESNYTTALTVLMLLLSFSFSADFMSFLNYVGCFFNEKLAEILSFGFSLLFMVSIMLFFRQDFKRNISNFKFMLLLIFSAAMTCLYAYLIDYNLQYIPFIVFSLIAFYSVLKTFIQSIKQKKRNFVLDMTNMIFAAAWGLQFTNILSSTGVISIGRTGFSLIYNFLIFLMYIFIYIGFVLNIETKALKLDEYKIRYEKTKINNLRNQMNPHFTFNMLLTIKTLYHEDISEGDYALTLFSRHLRRNVEAIDDDLIPFEKELDSLEIYTELENIRHDSKFNIIFDVDYSDFLIPAFTLQPFVENAVKYSKIDSKEDGFIQITSYKQSKCAVVQVIDNGVGFDVGSIGDKSYGIKNVRERCKLLIGVEPKVESKIGEGTTVTLKIPLGR